MPMEIELTVNGFTDVVSFAETEIAAVHRPILNQLHALAAGMDRRLVVLFAAPPGAGKSTIAAFWAWLSQQDANLTPIQTLAIDGFHYPNRYLLAQSIERDGKTMPLKSIKGAPETYDVQALCQAVVALKEVAEITWPVYDRTIHDPVPDAMMVTAPIVVIEGNWVLLDEPAWRPLRDMADLGIFLAADEALVRERLIQRKARGGTPMPEVEAHYERADSPNIERVLSCSLPADIRLRWQADERGKHTIYRKD